MPARPSIPRWPGVFRPKASNSQHFRLLVLNSKRGRHRLVRLLPLAMLSSANRRTGCIAELSQVTREKSPGPNLAKSFSRIDTLSTNLTPVWSDTKSQTSRSSVSRRGCVSAFRAEKSRSLEKRVRASPCGAPQRFPPQVPAVDLDQVEGAQHHEAIVAPVTQHLEGRNTVVLEGDGLAVDQARAHAQCLDGRADQRER